MDGHDLGALLMTLIAAAQETTAAVDAALILLRDERGALRVNAAVGLDEEPLRGLMLQATEELAEVIAARREACSLDALPPLGGISREVHAGGMGAVHGVPLMHDDRVVGVAIMGSRRAAVFSEEEKLLFHLVTSRALALIVQAQLMAQERAARREAERTGRAQRFLAAASAALSDSLDNEGTLGRIGRIAVPELADYCAVEVLGEDVEAPRLVTATHADPERAERARALFRELRPTPPLAALIRGVMRSERPQLFGDLRSEAQPPEKASASARRRRASARHRRASARRRRASARRRRASASARRTRRRASASARRTRRRASASARRRRASASGSVSSSGRSGSAPRCCSRWSREAARSAASRWRRRSPGGSTTRRIWRWRTISRGGPRSPWTTPGSTRQRSARSRSGTTSSRRYRTTSGIRSAQSSRRSRCSVSRRRRHARVARKARAARVARKAQAARVARKARAAARRRSRRSSARRTGWIG